MIYYSLVMLGIMIYFSIGKMCIDSMFGSDFLGY